MTFLLFSCQNQGETREEKIESDFKNQDAAEPILIALEEHNSNHGRYPDNLNDLIPIFLSEVPKTINGKEFEYSLDKVDRYMFCFNRYEPNLSGCCYYRYLETWDCTPGHTENNTFEILFTLASLLTIILLVVYVAVLGVRSLTSKPKSPIQ